MIEHTQTLPSLQENSVISRLNRKEWIEKDGEDLPEIRNWKWPGEIE